MNIKGQEVTKVWVMTLLLGMTQLAWGQKVEVVSMSTAKGIIILRGEFPSRGKLHSFGLEVSSDGETFVDAKAGPMRGLRFTDRMVQGSHEADDTVLLVPVVGRFDFTPQGFLFEEEGTYYLRWDITFKDRHVGEMKIGQIVVVEPATNPDLEFLSRIGDRDFATEVLGLNPPENVTGDLLALGLISEILQYAEDDPGEGGRVRGKLAWAEAFWNLAKELPESSYAAYAAFCAGRIYHGHLARTLGREHITPKAKKHTLYEKADEALRFAVDHGDPFLKPRALCSLAYLRVCAAAWDEAERLLTQAEGSTHGQGIVESIVDEMRRDLAHIKEKRVPKERDPD